MKFPECGPERREYAREQLNAINWARYPLVTGEYNPAIPHLRNMHQARLAVMREYAPELDLQNYDPADLPVMVPRWIPPKKNGTRGLLDLLNKNARIKELLSEAWLPDGSAFAREPRGFGENVVIPGITIPDDLSNHQLLGSAMLHGRMPFPGHRGGGQDIGDQLVVFTGPFEQRSPDYRLLLRRDE